MSNETHSAIAHRGGHVMNFATNSMQHTSSLIPRLSPSPEQTNNHSSISVWRSKGNHVLLATMQWLPETDSVAGRQAYTTV